MRCEGMPKRVAGRPLANSGPKDRFLYRALHDTLVQMMASPLTSHTIHIRARGRKYPLPLPRSSRRLRLAAERPWQHDRPAPSAQVTFMQALYFDEVLSQRLVKRRRKHRRTILVTLSSPHNQDTAIEIDVLHAQRQRLKKPKT